MKRALCLFTVMVCLFFASACFAATDEGNIKDLETRALNGDADAQNAIGKVYLLGLYGVEQDSAKALEWLEKAAAQGYARSLFWLGLLYETGDGVKKDLPKAKELFKQACDKGVEEGCEAYKKLKTKGR